MCLEFRRTMSGLRSMSVGYLSGSDLGLGRLSANVERREEKAELEIRFQRCFSFTFFFSL